MIRFFKRILKNRPFVKVASECHGVTSQRQAINMARLGLYIDMQPNNVFSDTGLRSAAEASDLMDKKIADAFSIPIELLGGATQPRPSYGQKYNVNTVYHEGRDNICPHCYSSSWHIGRVMAQCAGCDLALSIITKPINIEGNGDG